MKSRRIILSDDEDSPQIETSSRMFLSTPNTSADLVNNMSNMNVRSSSEAADSHISKPSASVIRVANNVKKRDVVMAESEEDTFNSADELDPESTLRVMQGNLDRDSQEGDDYEAMIQPPRNARSSKADQNQITSSAGKSRPSRDQSQSSSQSATSRPRRQSAMRAEQLLHNLYSEYDRNDRQNKETMNDDESYLSQTSQSGNEGGSNSDSDQTTKQHGSTEETTRASKGANEFYWIDDSEQTPSTKATSRKSSRGSKKTSKSSERSTKQSNQHNSPPRSRKSRSSSSPATDNTSPDQPRRQSSRAATLSSRKEKDYLHAQKALRAASGLQSVLLSSSEEESEGDNDTRRPSRSKQHYASDEEDKPSRRSAIGSKNKKSPKTSYSYSVSQLRSPAKVVGLMYRNDERDEREDEYSDRTESDIDDFIVNSDEERAEEEAREEELRQLREQKKAAKKRSQSSHHKEQKNRHKGSRHTGKNAAEVIRRATEQYEKGVKNGNMNHPDSSEEEGMQVTQRSHSSSASKNTTTNAVPGGSGRKRKVIQDSSDEEPGNADEKEGSADEGEQGYLDIVANRRPTKNTQTTTTSSTTSATNVNTASNATSSAAKSNTSNRKRNRPMQDFVASDSDNSELSHGEYTNNNHSSDSSEHSSSSGSEGSGSGSDGESSDQSSEDSEVDASDLDGPMLYYKVNSMRDRQEDGGDFANLANMRKRFSVPEAMQYYIELLAHTLIDPHYLQECHHPDNSRRPKHSTHQQRQDQRQLTVQRSNYLSATRQLENSICTNRESLIGSGAWNKEFYGELQSRPFYSSGPTLLCHDSRNGFGMQDGYEDFNPSDWDKVKCAACNRSTQRPDLQVYLFGSTYDAGKVWNSTKWDQHLPPELFLYKEEEIADDAYQHHPQSNSNNPSATNSATKHNPLYDSHHSSAQKARKNKQFQGYQTIMNSNIGTYGGKYTIHNNNNTSNSSATKDSQHGNMNVCTHTSIHSNPTSSIKKSTLRPDEDMVTTIHNRKRRIVLSDTEDGNGSEMEGIDEGKISGVSGGSGHKRRRANSEEFIDGTTTTMVDLTQDSGDEEVHYKNNNNDNNNTEDQDMGNEASELEVVPSSADDICAAQLAQHKLEEQELTRAWWKQKFPRELTREKESVFYLSSHCKSRTRLYHTLLHYKFRLLLNIREKIQDIANRMCGEQLAGSMGYTGTSSSSSGQKKGVISISNKYQQFDTSWQDWEPQDRRYLLEAAVDELKEDTIFVDNEARRFQTLIKETERRFGGREEPPRDIWGDEDHHGSHPAFAARLNSGNNTNHSGTGAGNTNTSSTNSSGSMRRPMSQQTKTIVGWLNKQK